MSLVILQRFSQISPHTLIRTSNQNDFSLFKEETSSTEGLNCGHAVAYEQNRTTFISHSAHLTQTLSLKGRISDSKNLVHKKNLRFQVSRDGKGKPHMHACRVIFYRRVEKLLYLRKGYDLIEFAIDLLFCHADDRTIEI